jgi:membrane protein implicated in regulation of membrane protease activity
MPTEYYLGAAVAVILVVLLTSLVRRWLARRQVLHNSNGIDQLTNQLSRIADALETLVVRLGASPLRAEQPSAPLQKASEPSGSDQGKSAEPTKPHVSLSMFGR